MIYQLCSRPGCHKRRPEGCQYLDDCSQCREAKSKRENRFKGTEQQKGYERLPFYKTSRWQKFRAFIISRDPVCKLCERQLSSVAHHIKPAREFPNLIFDEENVVGVCRTCHDKETRREIAERKRENKI